MSATAAPPVLPSDDPDRADPEFIQEPPTEVLQRLQQIRSRSLKQSLWYEVGKDIGYGTSSRSFGYILTGSVSTRQRKGHAGNLRSKYAGSDFPTTSLIS